jgi:hypothetical protein
VILSPDLFLGTVTPVVAAQQRQLQTNRHASSPRRHPNAFSRLAIRISQWQEALPRLLRLAYSAVIVAGMAFTFISERGWVVGLLAGLFYGVWLLGYAFSPGHVRAWEAKHVVAAVATVIPAAFFALLLLSGQASVWKAAGAALAIGAFVIPIKVRRRRRAMACRAEGQGLSPLDPPAAT